MSSKSSPPRFAEKHRQYPAFIHTYTLLNSNTVAVTVDTPAAGALVGKTVVLAATLG